MASLKENLSRIEWLADNVGRLDGIDFFFDAGFEGAPESMQLLLKTREALEQYGEVLGGADIRNIVDLGIWEGGSALVFALLFDTAKIAALDICPPFARFDQMRKAHPAGRRIAAYYETSQDDEAAIGKIIDAEFDGPLDLVIDDASHHYGLSKRSFEILFPRLAPGGWYVVEDWGWAHGLVPIWPESPSLANLVFKLQLAWVCRPDLIAEVVVKREMVFIRKSKDAPMGKNFDVDDLYILHNRQYPLIA